MRKGSHRAPKRSQRRSSLRGYLALLDSPLSGGLRRRQAPNWRGEARHSKPFLIPAQISKKRIECGANRSSPGGTVSRTYAYLLSLCLLAALPATAQAPGVTEVYAQIKTEETNNSKIMWIIHEIADVYGPRVTGTPNLKVADDWAVKTMASWGLVNTHLEPWTFQPPSAANALPGWTNDELAADAVSPFTGQLIVKPLAWTPGTKGAVTAQVVQLLPPGLTPPGAGFGGRGGTPRPAGPNWAAPPMPAAQTPSPAPQPTEAELDAYLISMRDKVRGHIVLVGKHVEVAENFFPAPLRRTEDEWKAAYDPNNPNGGRFGGGGGRGPTPLPEGQLTAQQVNRVVDQFLVDHGALAG